MLKRSLRNNDGSALVELALVLPLLCLLLIGAAELGRIAYYSIEVSNAARAAVAYGSQSTATAGDPSGMATAAQLAAADVPSLSATASNACVCETINSTTGAVMTIPIIGACGGTTSTASTQCPSSTITGTTNLIVNYVQVSTSAQVSTMFNYPGLPDSYTLKGFAKMRVVQN